MKREPRILFLKSGQHVKCLCYFLLALCLSCTLPETEISQRSPIEILPSNREREAPPILGIRYLKTIGRAGQGVGEFRTPLGLAMDQTTTHLYC